MTSSYRLLPITSCAMCINHTLQECMVPMDAETINQKLNSRDPVFHSIDMEFRDDGIYIKQLKRVCDATEKEIPDGGYPIPDFCPLKKVEYIDESDMGFETVHERHRIWS